MNEYGPSAGIARNASESQHPGLWRGLVGLWCPSAGRQGGKLIDFANKYEGTLTNGPSWVSGRRGQALSFDGVDDYVACGTGAKLQPPMAVSVCAWVKKTVSVAYGTVVANSTGVWSPPYASYALQYDNLTNNIYFLVGSSANLYVTPTAVTPGNEVWYHACGTYDGVTARLYIDGKLSASAALAGPLKNYPGFSIGRVLTQPYNFNGLVDDVRVYSRTLSPVEVMATYMGASPLVRRREDVGFWRSVAAAVSIFRSRAGSRGRLSLAA